MAMRHHDYNRINDLFDEGLSTLEISHRLGCSQTTARRALAGRLPERGEKQPRANLNFGIPIAVDRAIHLEAKKRGIPKATFLRRLLCTIAQDNLFNGVLDDEPQSNDHSSEG